MRKFAIVILVVIVSCQSRQEKVIEDVSHKATVYLTENLKDFNPSAKIDSVRFINFDTLTESNIAYGRWRRAMDEVSAKQDEFRNILDEMDETEKTLRLSSGIVPAIYENARKDYLKQSEKMQDIQAENNRLSATSDSLGKIAHNADSTTMKFLQGNFLIQVRSKDLSVKRDTANIIFNPQMDIIAKEDLLR